MLAEKVVRLENPSEAVLALTRFYLARHLTDYELVAQGSGQYAVLPKRDLHGVGSHRTASSGSKEAELVFDELRAAYKEAKIQEPYHLKIRSVQENAKPSNDPRSPHHRASSDWSSGE